MRALLGLLALSIGCAAPVTELIPIAPGQALAQPDGLYDEGRLVDICPLGKAAFVLDTRRPRYLVCVVPKLQGSWKGNGCQGDKPFARHFADTTKPIECVPACEPSELVDIGTLSCWPQPPNSLQELPPTRAKRLARRAPPTPKKG